MHEVRVHDRRRGGREEARTARGVGVDVASRQPSVGTPPARASPRRTRGRPARPRAARACARPSRARAAAAAARAGAPPSPEMPETFWTCRTRHRSSASLEHAVGPVPDRVVALDPRAQLAAERGACSGPMRRSAHAQPRRERRPAAVEAELDARAGASRSPGSRRARAGTPPLPRRRPCRARRSRMLLTSTPARAAEPAPASQRDRVARSLTPSSRSGRAGRSSSVSDGPRDLELDAVGELRAPRRASRSPWPARSGRARAARSGPRSAARRSGIAATSIPCPIACTFGESSGNERRVDREHGGRDALGGPQQRSTRASA